MSQKLHALVLAVCGSILLLGCGSDEEASNACTAAPPSDAASADGKVTYSASVTGNGTVVSLVYQADSKAVTVNHPSLPFEVTVDVKEDDPIGISVTGSASNGGKVTAAYAFVDSGGTDPVEVSADCGR
ncbi:MAG TPA: hypothetical protein VHM25_10630 [Polyangiaceae bacterium]|jgi:hypothetical protein|nr:hypothetical protein [Polyangiaceae bacterium]